MVDGQQKAPRLTSLGRWAIGLTGTVVVFSAAAIPFDVVAATALGQLDPLMSDPEYDRLAGVADWALGVSSILAVPWLLAFVAGLLVLLVWIYRAWRSLPALGSGPMRWSAAWAVGAWFVPFLNLVRPAQVIGDLNRASMALSEGNPGRAWSYQPFGAVVWGWWLPLVVASQFSRTAWFREQYAESLQGADLIGTLHQVAWLHAIAGIGYVLSGICLMRIVGKVTRRITTVRGQATAPPDEI